MRSWITAPGAVDRLATIRLRPSWAGDVTGKMSTMTIMTRTSIGLLACLPMALVCGCSSKEPDPSSGPPAVRPAQKGVLAPVKASTTDQRVASEQEAIQQAETAASAGAAQPGTGSPEQPGMMSKESFGPNSGP